MVLLTIVLVTLGGCRSAAVHNPATSGTDLPASVATPQPQPQPQPQPEAEHSAAPGAESLKSSPATATVTTAPRSLVWDLHLFDSGEGWVLGEKGLLATGDAGGHWQPITPSSLTSDILLNVFFPEPKTGWVVSGLAQNSSGQPANLQLSATADGGRTWNTQPLAPKEQSPNFGGQAYVNFADARHGWLVLREATSSNFSLGQLYATSNGGQTWQLLPPPPIAEPVLFVSPTTGWLSGGPGGNNLYVSRDGGQSWQVQTLNPPAAVTGLTAYYSRPVFFNSQEGVLSVTYRDPTSGKGILIFYQTADSGKSWAAQPDQESVESQGNLPVPTSVVNARLRFSAPSSGLALVQHDGSTRRSKVLSAQTQRVAGAGQTLTVSRLNLKNSEEGWILLAGTSCSRFKSQCSSQTVLLSTHDGGQSVQDITP